MNQSACPICGDDHPPIECLAKSLAEKKALGGMPFVLVPMQNFVAPHAIQLTSGAVVHAPGCPCHPRRVLDRNGLPLVGLRGSPMTRYEAQSLYRKKKRVRRPHCRACQAEARHDTFLDYAFCPSCNRTLSKEDVYWKRSAKEVAKKRDRILAKRKRKRARRKKRREDREDTD